MLVPEAFGGMEFDASTYVVALEELAWGEPSVALMLALTSSVADVIVTHGSDVQKRRWLESLARGDAACSARAHADGSDVRATRQGDEWVLSGSKKWVTNGRDAKLALVSAGGEGGNAVFLIPTSASGYSVTHRHATMGFRPAEIVTVELADVRLDADDRIAVGESELLHTTTGWLSVAAISTGIAQAALDHARAYADVREQFNTKLRNFEGVQFKLADMALRTTAARALLQNVAAEPNRAGAAMAKIFASETAMWVTTQAVQIFGGYGYMRDYPVEKLMRDAKATEILEGSNDALRVIISDELYK
jgi:alkylation response protein AidB-like acyl-CoA dehydrogenase